MKLQLPARAFDMTALGVAILGIALQSVALAAPPARPVYRVVALPTVIPNVNLNQVYVGDINSAGDVVGSLTDSTGVSVAVFWDGQTHGINVLKSAPSSVPFSANLINDSRVIVGRSYATLMKRPAKGYAVTWDSPSSDFIRLPLIDSKARYEVAAGINGAGVVVGSTYFGSIKIRSEATMWSPGGSVTSLGYLPGAENGTVPEAINDSGVVVGNATNDTDKNIRSAFMWTAAGGFVDLGLAPGTEVTGAVDINDANQIVLTGGDFAQTTQHIYTWTASTGYVDLGAMPNPQVNTHTSAARINNSGVVLGGYTYVPDNNPARVLYGSAATGLVDLISLIDPNDQLKAVLTEGTTRLSIGGLNYSGMISLGYSTNPSPGVFNYGAVVLVPAN